MESGAYFSEDRVYRYSLWRRWARPANRDEDRTALVIGLNPSTADETVDDPTIRRCVGFAKTWGCHRLVMGNLFALRATDPTTMLVHPDPVGPDNDRVLLDLLDESHIVVAAWGAHGAHRRRHREVIDLLTQCDRCVLYCFGVTSTGQPKHPLYLRGDTPLSVFCQSRKLLADRQARV